MKLMTIFSVLLLAFVMLGCSNSQTTTDRVAIGQISEPACCACEDCDCTCCAGEDCDCSECCPDERCTDCCGSGCDCPKKTAGRR